MIFLLKGFALLLPPIRTLICIELMLGRLRICKPKRFAKLPAKPTTIQRQTTQALTCRLFMLSCFFCEIPCISISVIYHLSALLKHPKTETFHQKRVVTFFCIFFLYFLPSRFIRNINTLHIIYFDKRTPKNVRLKQTEDRGKFPPPPPSTPSPPH